MTSLSVPASYGANLHQCPSSQEDWHRTLNGGSVFWGITVNSIKLETGLKPNSAGIPYTLLFRIEAIGFPTFGLLL